MNFRWMAAGASVVALSGCVELASNVLSSKDLYNDGRAKIWERIVSAEMLAQTKRHRLEYHAANLSNSEAICVQVSFDNLKSTGGDYVSGQRIRLEPGAKDVEVARAETTVYQGIQLDLRYHVWTPGTEGTNANCLKS